ncbi:hypothetical protein [Cohnella rhizosphaerae]|uniref:Uncharacterized protein n=1 Tax=Cohnella rhizosphaerae TaxID=1457232 RepID=A0A9X4QWP4_9BACL|nr:hypothetical protein [Cohnella rhizosphaerae]MDG0813869.1 hypothetical protein [Cohnella rhizosphaerae]
MWRSSDTLAVSFRYGSDSGTEEDKLSWSYPLASGVRATKIAVYDADRKRAAEATAAFGDPKADRGLPPIEVLALWHSFLALDKVKDWVLDWEEPQERYPRLFDPALLPKKAHLWYFDLYRPPTPEDMEEIVGKLSFNFNQIEGTSPVTSREFAYWTPVFDLAARDMTPEQFRRCKAASAFMAYVREDEYVAPIHTMLGGPSQLPCRLQDGAGIHGSPVPPSPACRSVDGSFRKSDGAELEIPHAARRSRVERGWRPLD